MLVRDAEPIESETEFYEQVRLHVPSLQNWYNADSDGTRWMIVSYDDRLELDSGSLRCQLRDPTSPATHPSVACEPSRPATSRT